MSEQAFECHFCGGKVTAQQINVMRHWKGRYILIEEVPAYVCTQCGEQYYDGVVAEAMDQIMQASETTLSPKRQTSEVYKHCFACRITPKRVV